MSGNLLSKYRFDQTMNEVRFALLELKEEIKELKRDLKSKVWDFHDFLDDLREGKE